MAVKEWIGGFLQRHQALFAPHDWPGAAAPEEWREFTRGWITALALRQVTEDEASEASRRLTAKPPAWRREHIPAILEAVEAIRRERGAPPAATMNREEAEAMSKSCDRCGGGGLLSVYHPNPDYARRIPPTMAAYCTCSMGRWVERTHREKSPDVRRRMPDLADVLAGRSVWMTDPPGMADNLLMNPPGDRPCPGPLTRSSTKDSATSSPAGSGDEGSMTRT